MNGNCIVAQSGGPTSAINASLCGVFREMSESSAVGKIYGGINGIQGILQEKLLDMRPILQSERQLRLLRQSPSASLASCRFKLKSPADRPEEYARIFEVFEKFDIRYFIYIGGNDSMDTVLSLSKYAETIGREMRFMGVPKTIDNDLVGTDHTPGFGSCAKYVATSIKEVAHDNMVYDMDSVAIIETMGRDAGWIALSAALARDTDGQPLCDLIYTPETPFSEEKFLSDLAAVRATKRQVIVVASEGIKDAQGVYISETGEKDPFGHAMLRGAGSVLADIVRRQLSIKVRPIELSLLQRCAAHLTSKTDLDESENLGRLSARGALDGMTGKMSAIKRLSDAPYEIEYNYADLNEVANAVKRVPDEYFNAARNHATDKALNYLRPLIVGENETILEDDMPVFLNLAAVYAKQV